MGDWEKVSRDTPHDCTSTLLGMLLYGPAHTRGRPRTLLRPVLCTWGHHYVANHSHKSIRLNPKCIYMKERDPSSSASVPQGCFNVTPWRSSSLLGTQVHVMCAS